MQNMVLGMFLFVALATIIFITVVITRLPKRRSPSTGPLDGFSIKDVCYSYYEREIFGNRDYPDIAYDYVAKGQEAKELDEARFREELAGLRMELFGLALWNNKSKTLTRSQRDWDSAIITLAAEIGFTKSYLEGKERGDVWQTTGWYNKAVGDVVTDGRLRCLSLLSKIFPSFVRMGGGHELGNDDVMRNLSTYNVSEELQKLNPDAESLNRTLNRVRTGDGDWLDGSISQALASTFAQRLGCDASFDWQSMFRLQQLVSSAYENATRFVEICFDPSPRIFAEWREPMLRFPDDHMRGTEP